MSKVLLCYEDYAELMNIQSVLKKVGFDVLPISSEFSLSQQILAFNPDIVVGYGKGPKVSTVGVGRRLKEMPRWVGRVVLLFPAGAKPDPSDLVRIRMDMALEAPLEITRLIQVLANLTNQDPQALVERMMKAVAQEAQAQARSVAAAEAKKDDAVFVTGSREAVPSWNVGNTKELDEFNRMMGLTPAATVVTSSATALPSATEDPTLVGGASPEMDGIDAAAIRRQVEAAHGTEADKVKSYERFLKDPLAVEESTLTRKDARKAQKDLKKDWSEKDLQNQDRLRREFTQALFKKKN